jgi:adenosylhomocysteine nucleosidase
MGIVRTWLVVAAERREFDGILKRMGKSSLAADGKASWPGVRFSRQAMWKGDRWWMIANGPGAELVKRALMNGEAVKNSVDGILSTGLCGALDPALRVGSGDAALESPARFVRGAVHTADRVIGTAKEKRMLRHQTGAVAVDMEAAAVQAEATERKVPFLCVRVVSDTAGDTLPLDFNRYRNARGDFSRSRIALAAVAHPFTVLPQLMEFDRNCRRAADALGDFLADCRF